VDWDTHTACVTPNSVGPFGAPHTLQKSYSLLYLLPLTSNTWRQGHIFWTPTLHWQNDHFTMNTPASRSINRWMNGGCKCGPVGSSPHPEKAVRSPQCWWYLIAVLRGMGCWSWKQKMPDWLSCSWCGLDANWKQTGCATQITADL